MTLNYNSFNAKLYRYFYNEREMPNSICPYFWKLLMAWVFIIPVSIFSFPAVIGEIITKQSVGLFRVFASFFLYLVICVVTAMVCTIMLFFNEYDGGSPIVKLGVYGFVFWLAAIAITVVETVKYIRNNNKLEDSVIVGFVKSKYISIVLK